MPLAQIDRLLVSRALTNVIENALHAMPRGGRLRFTSPPSDTPGMVMLSVDGYGSGDGRRGVARIFEPYFSTKTTGHRPRPDDRAAERRGERRPDRRWNRSPAWARP